jgi:hypothetical protein
VDHVLARAQGGTDHPDNLITACRECNEGKGSLLLDAPERPIGGPVIMPAERRDRMQGFAEALGYPAMDVGLDVDYALLERATYLLPPEEIYAAIDEALAHFRVMASICSATLTAGLYRRIAARQSALQQLSPPPTQRDAPS